MGGDAGADTHDDPATTWRDYFGYADPYENQADAIEAAIDLGERDGFLAMEGPCGTGKTMAALTAAAYLVRETDRFDRVMVATPVKQQLAQFVEDLRTLNAGLDEPLSGVGLVGKADLCPYGREGAFPPDVGVHTRCQDLRDTTAELVERQGGDSDGTVPDAAEAAVAVPGVRPDADVWWDPARARTLVREARLDADTYRRLDDPLRTAGAKAPYPRGQPAAPDTLAGGDAPLYCPFEADWYARDKGSPIGFDAGDQSVVTADEYLPAAVERGTCPHRVMGVLLEAADVVIGNYNHLFDPSTRALTETVIDDRTFVIVDEAHRLEGRVRDLLSDGIGVGTLRHARGDLRRLLARAEQGPDERGRVAEHLDEFDVTVDAVEHSAGFYDDAIGWLEDRVRSAIEDRFDEPASALRRGDLDDVEIPLRDPETVETDEFTRWMRDEGYAPGFIRSLSTVGKAVERTLDTIDPDRSCVATASGALLGAWIDRDHAMYFREIEVSTPDPGGRDVGGDWTRALSPRLTMFNCMPADALASVFGDVGGGILMSATLEPLDVFRRVSGLDELGRGDDARPIEERTYDLPFPAANRASWIVDTTPFTARNRGDPAEDTDAEARAEYARVITDIARSPGNVMLCLPNYREAEWAAAVLRNAVAKPILLDESSTTEETDEIRQSFMRGGPAVIVTSTRGTLTEGVDYAGDALHTCAVIGVPLVNIGSPRIRAVRRAYGDAFGEERAFEYALTVPAVRRARQALGRVIRGPDERGVRILVDRRYTPDARFGSVHPFLPTTERDEFVRMTPMFLAGQIEEFWDESP